MGMFDVYVDGATDPSPQALQRLAEVMSQRYGLPAADLVTRLAKGRFRVKANVDPETASTYVKDLEAIGARVTLVEVRPQGSSLPPPRPAASLPPRPGVSQPPTHRSPLPLPARPAQPSSPPSTRPHRPSESPPKRPEHAIDRPFSSSQAPPNRPSSTSTPPGNQQYASGLSAAFHEDTPIPELGALDNQHAFSLSSVDGQDDVAAPAPVTSLPASMGPAPAPAPPKPAAKVERPKDVPLDLFAPPESQTGEIKFELAPDEIAHREARKAAATPPAPVPIVDRPSSPALRQRSSSLPPLKLGGTAAPGADDETPRWRFASGILVAVILGFIPAHCVAQVRESSLDDIDQHVVTVESQANRADAPIPAAQIDLFRAEQLSNKKSKRNNIALVSLLIWGVIGGGVGYVWFRRLPWDKIKFGRDWS